MPPTTRELLREIAQTTDAEWAAIARGEAVAKVLATDNREVAVAGAVRIAASSANALPVATARLRISSALPLCSTWGDSACRRAPTISCQSLSRTTTLTCGIADPATAASASARRKSRDSTVRSIGAATTGASGRGPSGSSTCRIRGRLHQRRTSALPTFVNKPEPLSVPAEFSLLVDRFAFVGSYAPAFLAYLREFGPGPEGLDKIVYWSKDDFGVGRCCACRSRRSTARLGDPRRARRHHQIYADHHLTRGSRSRWRSTRPSPVAARRST